MWVFLNNSFFSAVAHPTKPRLLVVRGRLRGDLQAIWPGRKVYETPGRDYRFRVFIDRDVLAKTLAEAARNISYGNFKDSVKDRKRHDAYLGVWGVMARAQDDENRPARQPAFSYDPNDGLGFDFDGKIASRPKPKKRGKRKAAKGGDQGDWNGPIHRQPLSVPF
jgi:hypothetical protein